MVQFLKIENPGVCPTEGFTVLGASSKRELNLPGIIGNFGSGCKMGVNALLRKGLTPVIFCGSLKLEFDLVADTLKSDVSETGYFRVQVAYSGKDESGKNRRYTEKLWSVDYGVADWTDVAMALREFVSNAIDHSILYNHTNGVNGKYPWMGVNIELVEENQVRAKAGTTRVFIPATDAAVRSFFVDIGKWFLHFSEPDLLTKKLLPKRERNLKDNKGPVFFRRGVRVGELVSCDSKSLFDYNLEVKIDESRNLNEYTVKAQAADVMAGASPEDLAILLKSFVSGTKVWEWSFDQYYLTYAHSDEIKKKRDTNWANAMKAVGTNAVLTGKAEAESVSRKGYTPVIVPEAFLLSAKHYDSPNSIKLLTSDERDGRQIIPPTAIVGEILDYIWGRIVWAGLNNGKDKPEAFCFNSIMDAGIVTMGFYRDGKIYVNSDIAVGESNQLRSTLIEELAHFCTNAGDNSRDLQDWAFSLIGKLV